MKKYRVWAWIVLGIFLLGCFALIIGFLTSNNQLGTSGLIFAVLGIIGTYFLKRDRDNRNAQQKEMQKEHQDIKAGRKASAWDPSTYDVDESCTEEEISQEKQSIDS